MASTTEDIKILKETAESAKAAAKAIHTVTESLSAQMSIVQSLNDLYTQFANIKTSTAFADLTKSLTELQPEVETFIKNSQDSSKELQDLLKDVDDLDTTLESFTTRTKDVSKTLIAKDGLSTGLASTAKNAKLTGGLFKWLGTLTKGSLTVALGGLGGAVSGIISTFTSFIALGQSLGSLFTNLVSWSLNLGAAIISIPVRFLGGLVEMASQLNLGMTEYLRKIEEVRDKFGNFKVGQSLAIKEMQKGFAKTTETGLNAWRIYGDLAERLQAITELVEGMGATWGKFSDEFAADGYLQAKRIDEFRMGLGLSQEQLKSTLMLSSSMGKSAGKSLTDLTKHVKAYASTLNISHKVLARDVADALKDAGKFGGSTVAAIARASAYARGLGHELKEIAGVLDAFETFDSAAESAAKLAQSFGMTVDAFKLVAAQSPDEMIQTLRDSMFAAGKSADQMNRQELKLLASQSGLSEEVARSVFSMKNQGRSVEDLMKLQEKQEDAQTTQANALKSLSEDIRRLVKDMQPLQKTFVAMFVDGMKKGATRSKEFLSLMMEIRQGLMLTWREGFKLGQVLIKEVPGLKMLFEGLHAFFEPTKFQKLASKMRFILLDFFRGTNGVKGLLHSAKDAFMDFFDSENPAAKKMIEGAKIILKRISTVFAEGISWVGKQMTTGIKFITDVISGKQKIADVGSMGKAGLGFMGDLIMPLIKSIIEVAPGLANAVLDLIVVAGSKAFDLIKSNKTVQSTMHNIGFGMMGFLAISVASRAVIGALVGGMTNSIIGAVGKVTSGGLSKKIADAGSKVAAKTPQIPGAEKAGGQTSSIVDGWVKVAISAKQVTLQDIGKLFLVLTAIGAGMGTAVVLFASGVRLALDVLRPAIKSEKDIITMLTLIGTSVITFGIAALAAKSTNLKDLGMVGIALVAIGGALAIGGVAFAMGVKAMTKQLAGIKLSELVPVFIALAELIGSTVVVAASMSMIGKFADPKSMLLGGAAMGVAATGILLVTGAVGLLAKGFQSMGVSPTMLKATGDLMQSMSVTMLLMVPILVSSAALGAVLMGPQGALIAIAASIGFAAITTGIVGLTGVTFSIIKILNDMPNNSGLKEKATVFTNILGAINNLITIIAGILREFSPGLTDFLSIMTGGKITDRIESTTKFITQLIPNIQNLVEIIKSSIVSLTSGGPLVMRASTIFASIFESLSSFTKLIVPPKELLQSETEEYGMFSSTITKVTGSATDYIKSVSGSVTTFMNQVVNVIKQISGMNMSETMMQNGIPAIAGMLKAVALIMSALVPDSETVKQFRTLENNETDTGMFTTTVKKQVEKIDVAGLKSMLTFITANFNTLLQTMTSEGFKNFLASAANIVKNPQQLKSLEAVGGIMTAIGTIIKSISDASKSPEMKSISGENIKVNINFKPADINKTLQDLSGESGGIKKMFDTILTLTSTLGNTKDLSGRLNVLKGVFDGIGQVANFIKTMNESTKNNQDVGYGGDISATLKPLSLLDNVLSEMSKGGEGSIKSITDKLQNIAGQIDTTMLKSTADKAAELCNFVKTIKNDIVDKGIVPALEAVKKMSETVNEMNSALENIQLGKKSVQTGLQNVANSLGVGGRASYTINNKPINIHLEIQVEMKAAEVEKMIVFRKESVIRDQIRWIRGSEQGRDAFQDNNLSTDVNTRYIQHVPG